MPTQSHAPLRISAFGLSLVLLAACQSEVPQALAAADGVQAAQPVAPDDFIRAESDRYFHSTMMLAGGVNRFNFGRRMLSLDEQTVVRMNRDTLYGGAVIDTQGGASITFPEIPDGRYASILVLDNDHYAPLVIYEPGTYPLPDRTRYVLAAVRIHVRDPDDPEEIAAVNALQDRFTIQASSDEPFPQPAWDTTSLDALRVRYEAEFSKFEAYPDGWMGAPGEADEQTRHLAAAGAWGLFPNWDALYINHNPGLPATGCYRATYPVPGNDAFWSITVYGADGYMKSDHNVLNGDNATFDPDGGFTAHFGSAQDCGEVANRIDIAEGWNFLMRIYRPHASVLGGGYVMPRIEPVS